jgi:hypothetical protein
MSPLAKSSGSSVATSSSAAEGEVDLAGSSRSALPLLSMVFAGVLTGVLVSAAGLRLETGTGAAPSLEAVAVDQIDAAIMSLGPQLAAGTIDDARQCKTPLTYVTISAAAGTTANSIRIRSGAYLSPPIAVTPTPRRVAIPYPAPYPTGKGVLIVEGTASGLNVWLTPGQHYTRLDGPAAISVIWAAKSPPC